MLFAVCVINGRAIYNRAFFCTPTTTLDSMKRLFATPPTPGYVGGESGSVFVQGTTFTKFPLGFRRVSREKKKIKICKQIRIYLPKRMFATFHRLKTSFTSSQSPDLNLSPSTTELLHSFVPCKMKATALKFKSSCGGGEF